MAATPDSNSNSNSRYISEKPTAIASTAVTIHHPQLRDLVSCPHKQGVLTYLRHNSVVEQDLNQIDAPIRSLVDLRFEPSSLDTLAIGEDTLVASGGSWHAELHLSYHRPANAHGRGEPPADDDPVWQYNCRLDGTLNNSVLLTTSTSSSAEPRVAVTNNDGTFRLYDCAIRRQPLHYIHHDFDDEDDEDESEDEDEDEEEDSGRLECVGSLKLDTCVNYAALSPRGRMVVTVGDSPNVYLHDMRGSSLVDFHPIAIVPLPVPTNVPPHYPTTRPSVFTASFCAAWSADGSKYAVGSQEGVVAVYDTRRTSRPLHVAQVDKMRGMGPGGLAAAAGVISWDPSHWFTSHAPAWSIRNLKFVGDENGVYERLVFAEHTSLVHVLDAKTFEHDQVVCVPTRMREPPEPEEQPEGVPLHLYSHCYNRAESPAPSASPPTAAPPPDATVPLRSNSLPHPASTAVHTLHRSRQASIDSAVPPLPTFPAPKTLRFPGTVVRNGYVFEHPEFDYDDHDALDIAGLAFDPSGRYMYVGTAVGLVEWEMLRG